MNRLSELFGRLKMRSEHCGEGVAKKSPAEAGL
jgi:hypothetical protein